MCHISCANLLEPVLSTPPMNGYWLGTKFDSQRMYHLPHCSGPQRSFGAVSFEPWLLEIWLLLLCAYRPVGVGQLLLSSWQLHLLQALPPPRRGYALLVVLA